MLCLKTTLCQLCNVMAILVLLSKSLHCSAKSPIEWRDLDNLEEKLRRRLFGNGGIGLPAVKSSPHNVYMPRKFKHMAEDIYKMEVRPDDVWLITYPKSGTSWILELVWQVLHGLDFGKSRPKWNDRHSFIEGSAMIPPNMPFLRREQLPPFCRMTQEEDRNTRSILNSVFTTELDSSPRILKTHLPLYMLPPNLLDVAKVIVVGRNPRDVAVSFHHQAASIPDVYRFDGTFEDFAGLFRRGEVIYGNYWQHVKESWSYRHHPNLTFVWFEEMRKDFPKVARAIGNFLGRNFTEAEVHVLENKTRLKGFKLDEYGFMDIAFWQHKKNFRKGEVGSWRDDIDPADKDWNVWIEENLEGTDLPRDIIMAEKRF